MKPKKKKTLFEQWGGSRPKRETSMIHVRVTADEKAQIARLAKQKTGGNVGELIRRAVLDKL